MNLYCAGFTSRRKQLKEQWYFDCLCERCTDSADHSSSIVCTKCRIPSTTTTTTASGDLFHEPSEQSLMTTKRVAIQGEPEVQWQCQSCSLTMPETEVADMEESFLSWLQRQQQKLLLNQETLSEPVKHYSLMCDSIRSSSATLHSRHHLALTAKKSLVAFLEMTTSSCPRGSTGHFNFLI